MNAQEHPATPITFVRQPVVRCARCGGDHVEVLFHPFSNPPPTGHTHFGLCPANGEPILLRHVELDSAAEADQS